MKKKRNRKTVVRYNYRIVNVLDEYLLDQSKILKIGSKTGSDLVKLSQHYQITGSVQELGDVEVLQAKHPGIKIKHLDIRSLVIKDTYDCIYSNKILAALTPEELLASLTIQAQHLKDDGIILLTLPYGEETIEIENQVFHTYTETTISQSVPDSLRIILLDPYYEKAKNDSLLVILRKRQ